MTVLKNLFINKNNFLFSKNENIIINTLVIFLILLPITLISGPFLPDLTIVLISIFFIFFTFNNSFLLKYYNNFLVKFLFLFWIYLIISSLLSDYILFSLRSSFFYIRFIIFSIFIYFVLDNFPNFKKYFLVSCIIAFLIVIFDSLYQYINDVSLFGYIKPHLRLTGPFKDRQIVGSFLSRLLPLIIFIYITIKFKFDFKISILIIISLILVILSGERTAFFMITLFLFMFFIIYFNKKLFLIFLLLYMSLTTLIVFSNNDVKERIVNQTLQSFGISGYIHTEGEKKYLQNKPSRGFYIFSQSHEIHYKTAINMFLDNLITGVGPNIFRKECKNDKYFIEQSSCTTHPHNFPIQILAELGLLGFLFYSFMFFCLIYKLISTYYLLKIKSIELKETQINLHILHCGFLINIFLVIFPSGNFFNNYLNIIMFLPLGFYIYYSNYKND